MMPKRIAPEIGVIINEWLILECLGYVKGRMHVLARCKCGNVKRLPYTKITSNLIQSCGCAINQHIDKLDANKICSEYLQSILDYSPGTGIFNWKVRPTGAIQKGDQAGCIDGDGYIDIGIGGKHFKAHNLVWMYLYNKWPSIEIDHINRIRHDNRLSNLREATKVMQQHNKTTTLETTGVLWDECRKKWKVTMRGYKPNRRFVGRFSIKKDAIAARNNALQAKLVEEQKLLNP